MTLIKLLRNGTIGIDEYRPFYKNFVRYSKQYDNKWTDNELLENIITLNCRGLHLESLPEWPNCTVLYCCNNQLTNLPELPKCTVLYCNNNQLGSLPLCNVFGCANNQLKNLPELPNCTVLYCNNNQLKSLPELIKCAYLYCDNNQLPFTELSEWKVIWRMRNIYYGKKYIRLWYKRTWQIKVQKKYDLHLELMYSPKLPFYLEDEYCKHFKECQKQYKQAH
jgi:hypothetical protein